MERFCRSGTFRGGNVGGKSEHVRPVGVSSHYAASHLDGGEDLGEQAADKITYETITGLDVGDISLNLPHRLQKMIRKLSQRMEAVAMAFQGCKPEPI